MKYEKLSVKNQSVEASIVKKDYKFDPIVMRTSIVKGGKTLRSITLRWQGSLVKGESGWEILITGGHHKIPVILSSKHDPKKLKGQVTFTGTVIVPEKGADILPMRISEIRMVKS